MKIASRLARIKPSATLALNAKTQELRAQGRNVVSLAVGEPDFPTPEHIRLAAKQAIDAGFTRYTAVPGIPELRQAVAGYYARFYGVTPAMEATMVSNGGKQVLYNLFMALLEPGDEVLMPAPYWVSYPAMVALADAVPVAVKAKVEAGFKVTVEQLERARTQKTRMLIINTPSNPTGCHYSQAELDAMAEWAMDNNVFIVADEVYDRLVFAPAEPSSFCKWWEKAPEHVAIVGALSKIFAMTGWRLGFALAHPELIKAMTKIQGQSTSNVCSIVQKAALAAFSGPWDILEEMKKAFIRRRDLLMDIISGWPGATCPKPDGAFYVFPDLHAFMKDDTPDSSSLCRKILEQAEVALVPGAAFGDDDCVRFSYALDDETLIQAMDKVGRVLMK